MIKNLVKWRIYRNLGGENQTVMNKPRPLYQVRSIEAGILNHITKVQKKSKQSGSILSRLKDFARSVPDYPRLFQLKEEIHDRISTLSRSIREKGISVRWVHCFPKNREVFFGIAKKGYYMIGIHFLLSGDVFIGCSPYSLNITGTFIHLRGTNVEAGIYGKGTLIHKSKGFLVHSENWI